ncbi:PLC-like phosphodiesterase [Apodospora peruviana]|uniref:Phosphoinositide phospholipase C n=1 Tax=Apodospora peruviana TaxID=516989 RepID=A0AAE0M007_9PEZI|nr:PLC-like phosphodiesterase [Apodospora peruviana]
MSDPGPTSPGLSSRLAKLNPFSKSTPKHSHEADDEDQGEEIDPASVAGGGHSTRPTDITSHKLQVSSALQAFLVSDGVLPSEPGNTASALHELLEKPHVSVPASVTDRSHPLPEYYISSSHNTYLLAHQLFGSSSASAYETALNAGARCVEIDAWDNPDNIDEPKVTHGYTLVSNITFRAVCETIRDVVDRQSAASDATATPIMLSLENHCGDNGQRRLVAIMKEVFGSCLLDSPIETASDGESHVTLADLVSKVVVIVEYHLPNEASDSSSSSSSSESEDETEKQARHEYQAKKKAAPPTIIIPELAQLGVYAQSVKPADDSWFTSLLKNAPHHHLINVSETGLSAPMAAHAAKISRHNANHLMRVFPKGTRISSRNLPPVPFWALGAQICALNWQTFGASMQLNEALFAGTDGYVLKPAALRAGGDGVISSDGKKKRLKLRVAGASGVPLPNGREVGEIRPYLTCTMLAPRHERVSGGLIVDSIKRKTGVYKQSKLKMAGAFLRHPHGDLESEKPPLETDPVWDETLEWEFEDSELVFVRMLVKSDDSFASNPILAVAAVRLMYVTPGWSFVRMLDLKGRETKCSVLVRFDVEDVCDT